MPPQFTAATATSPGAHPGHVAFAVIKELIKAGCLNPQDVQGVSLERLAELASAAVRELAERSVARVVLQLDSQTSYPEVVSQGHVQIAALQYGDRLQDIDAREHFAVPSRYRPGQSVRTAGQLLLAAPAQGRDLRWLSDVFRTVAEVERLRP